MIRKIVEFIIIIFMFLPKASYSEIDPPNFEELAEETEKETKDYNNFTDRYNDWVFEHTKKVYTAQHIKSIIIFIIVLIIVLTGLYFSFIQFKHSVNKDFKNLNPEEKTNLKIGVSNIEITSSVIGLFILIISLAFFYLYLKEVYPIEILPSSEKILDENQIQN